MRTTLRVDDDVLLAVRERARRERRSAGEVLSDLARQALTSSNVHRPAGAAGFFGFEPLPPRGDAVSNALIDELRQETPEG
ncbi:MAG: CopG family transcriptional regulator [Acidimicrobiales bacterium]